MISVELEREDWDKVLAVLSEKPWAAVNPLIMKIGMQVQKQTMTPPPKGNSDDISVKSKSR